MENVILPCGKNDSNSAKGHVANIDLLSNRPQSLDLLPRTTPPLILRTPF